MMTTPAAPQEPPGSAAALLSEPAGSDEAGPGPASARQQDIAEPGPSSASASSGGTATADDTALLRVLNFCKRFVLHSSKHFLPVATKSLL